MDNRTYILFGKHIEFIQSLDAQHTYPLGSLVFGTLDFDVTPHLAQSRELLGRFRDSEYPESQTMKQSLDDPATCVYYQVAAFYHSFSAAVRQVSPALYDLVDGYCFATSRQYQRELEQASRLLRQIQHGEHNDSALSENELHSKVARLGNLAVTSDLMAGYCRSFPAYTDQMTYYLHQDTTDASLCRTALVVLESLLDLLTQLEQAKEDFRSLVAATLIHADGRPITEHGLSPADLLVSLAEKGNRIIRKYQKLEDDVHIHTLYKPDTAKKKGGLSVATYYASDTLPALVYLEFVQMCAQSLPVAECESCHRLFVPFSSRTKYCERMLSPETGASCKDIAAKLAYAEEMKADKAKSLYNKMRNRNQMRCSRAPDNQKMRDDYNAWRKKAQMAQSQYQLGEISWEELESILLKTP